MKKQDIQQLIREEIKNQTMEPQTSPIVKPSTKEPERKRRTLMPPNPNTLPKTKPKATFESKDLIQQILTRFKKFKSNES